MIGPPAHEGSVQGGAITPSSGLVKALLDGSTSAVPAHALGLVDVRDVAAVIAKAVQAREETLTRNDKGQKRYIMSSRRSYSILELARWMGTVSGAAHFWPLAPSRDSHAASPRHCSSDVSLSNSQF